LNQDGACDLAIEDVNHDGACDVEDCRGATGAQGPRGDRGDDGAPGAQGSKGDPGASGPQGPPGDAGAQGPKGDTGAQGPKGDQGPEGAHGLHCWDLNQDGACDLATEDVNQDGACDIEDCRGANGGQGPKGDTGDGGPQGPKGDTGAPGGQGPKGDPGTQGPQGAHGVNCWDLNQNSQCDLGTEDVNHDGTCSVLDCKGAQGAQGSKGDIGAQGPQGLTGTQGPKGDPGILEVYRSALAQGAASIPNTGASVTLSTVNLSSGTYLINAKMWLSNGQTNKTHYVRCSLLAQDVSGNIVDSDSTTATVVPAQGSGIPGATTLPFVIANVFPNPITVTLNCVRLDGNSGSTSAFDIKVTASQVSTLVTQ